MNDTAFGLVVLGTILLVFGGTGIYAAWPGLKNDTKRFVHRHSHRHP